MCVCVEDDAGGHKASPEESKKDRVRESDPDSTSVLSKYSECYSWMIGTLNHSIRRLENHGGKSRHFQEQLCFPFYLYAVVQVG